MDRKRDETLEQHKANDQQSLYNKMFKIHKTSTRNNRTKSLNNQLGSANTTCDLTLKDDLEGSSIDDYDKSYIKEIKEEVRDHRKML